MLDMQSSPFTRTFEHFTSSLRTSGLICSPYISAGPVNRLIDAIERRRLQKSINVKIVTDISLGNVMSRATDVSALIQLMERVEQVELRYLPRLHAKVYVAEHDFALVTSANFTDGGAFANLEYGVTFSDAQHVKRIRADIEHYAGLGADLTLHRLRRIDQSAAELRDAVQEEQRSVNAKLRAAVARLERETEEHLLRSRIEGRSIFSIFGDTVLYVLKSGPLTTVQLHEQVRNIHPDLCDDSQDRVIDGQHFGKLWKHQVRTAQQHLKHTNLVIYDPSTRLWALRGAETATGTR